MRIVNFTALSEVWQFGQRSSQNRFVARAVVRRAEGAADGVFNNNRARRCDLLHDVEGRADHQGGNFHTFDDVGDETDGLVAKRSVGHQQCQIHLRAPQLFNDGRGQLVFYL